MSEPSGPDTWIFELSLEQLREQAVHRGLSDAGTVTALRSRLTRYERAGRREPPPPSPAEDVIGPEFSLLEDEVRGAGASKVTGQELPGLVIPDQDIPDPRKEGSLPLKAETLLKPPPRQPSPVVAPPPIRTAISPQMSWPPREIPSEFVPSAAFHPPQRGYESRYSERFLSASDAYNTMRRWNLSFSGARGSDVETFLKRIEEGRDLVPIRDADLFKCLPFFLSGIALQWYRTKRSRWTTWGEFGAALRSRFGDPDFQFALRDEILRRTQGEHEPVADYLTCMLGLFDRLCPPWSEVEQLNYAHRNMLPRLQIAVHRDDFLDFDALERLATRVERSYIAASQYRAPPPPERSVCPDLAYRPPPRSARPSTTMTAEQIPNFRSGVSESFSGGECPRVSEATRRPARTTPQTPQRATQQPAARTGNAGARARSGASRETAEAPTSRPASRSSSAKCWNCDATGHFSRDCQQAPRVHCYRCGKAKETVRTCPQCSGNEGGRR